MKKFDIFNLACGESIKLNEVIFAIQNAFSISGIKKNNIVKLRKGREGDIFYSKASISKSKKLLGFRPLISFKEGIEHTINRH